MVTATNISRPYTVRDLKKSAYRKTYLHSVSLVLPAQSLRLLQGVEGEETVVRRCKLT